LSAALTELSRRLNYVFADADLLRRAVTHRSKGAVNNERLEFLGDSVLNFIIAAELYERYPRLTEGELTRLRARLVKQESLARLARTLNLGECLELGGGEFKSGGHDRDSILADALEAVFGAVFEDGGHEAARRVILDLYRVLLDEIVSGTSDKDPKTQLQELLQKRLAVTPVYAVLEVSGEAHQQHFLVECTAPGLAAPVQGRGANRRAAEQDAAAKALEQLIGH
jgi:ribonuclease-3